MGVTALAICWLTGATEWVFPNTKLNGSLDSKTVTKQVADRQRTDAPMSGRSKQIDALRLAGGHWRLWGERLSLLANRPANVVMLRAA